MIFQFVVESVVSAHDSGVDDAQIKVCARDVEVVLLYFATTEEPGVVCRQNYLFISVWEKSGLRTRIEGRHSQPEKWDFAADTSTSAFS